ncbi:MAG: DUF4474 domain-containing protein [Clostridia bacterium]|nr:DUF4474 domain-containing protein [Clostridia bacterium]
MKLSKKILSLILALIMSFSVCVPLATANETDNISGPEDYMSMLMTGGYPVISTEQFGVLWQILNTFVYILTGEEINTGGIEITIDDFLSEISAEICENSGLDLALIVKNLPDINAPAKLIGKIYEIDTTAFRNERYAKRDEYRAEGNLVMSAVCHAIGAYMSIIEELNVSTKRTDDPDVYQLVLDITYQDGTKETHTPGLVINRKTGECYNLNGDGIFGTGYNFSINEMMVYTTIDCWMRNFGFCLFYDIAANSMPLFFKYNTRRFQFEYDGTEWMIQIWKGNYFITNGGEIGIYSRKPGSFGSFYNCATDEQTLDMSLQVYYGEKLLVNRPLQKHWWLSGFNIGPTKYLPSSLRLKASVVMPDEGMLKAFTDAIDNCYMNDVRYGVDGLTVTLVW